MTPNQAMQAAASTWSQSQSRWQKQHGGEAAGNRIKNTILHPFGYITGSHFCPSLHAPTATMTVLVGAA